MTSHFTRESAIEEVLLSSDFYSSNNPFNIRAGSNGHAHSLKNSIGIKPSTSSTSISKSLPAVEKTGSMKNSPSITALEHILNERSKEMLPFQLSKEAIQEEEDSGKCIDETSLKDMFHQPPHPYYASGSVDTNRNSNQSIQTFETARSYKSNGSGNKKSISTIGESEVGVATSLLAAPATSDLQPSEEGVRSSVEKEGSNLSRKEFELKKEAKTSTDLAALNVDSFDHHNVSQNDISSPTKQDSNELKNIDPLSSPSKTNSYSMLEIAEYNKSNSVQDEGKPNPKMSRKSVISSAPKNAPNTEGTVFRSPHSRSRSSLHFSFDKNKEQPALPGSHRRSNTEGNLSKIASSAPNKKRFSVRALFKVKSKNHSLSESINEPLQPSKLKSKSFSTSNLSGVSEPKNSSATSNKNARNGNTERTSAMNHKRNVLSQSGANKPVNEKNEVATDNKMRSSKSLMGIFRKGKNHEDSFEMVQKDTKKQAPVDAMDKINAISEPLHTPKESYIRDGASPTAQDFHEKQRFKSDTNINYIREVDMDNVTPKVSVYESDDSPEEKVRYAPSYPELASKDNYPSLRPNNGVIISSLPLLPKLEIENDLISFGSPFDAKYESDTHRTPKQSEELNEETVFSEKKNDIFSVLDGNDRDSCPTKVNEQLLGEALFPKSLSAQEVESIVSLERSRSVRSVKSHKRNSFVNFEGNSEYVQYEGDAHKQSPSTGLTRSTSILKNSNSKKSLNVNDYEQPITSIDDTMDIFADLEEYTNYIDFDNLNFSTSPVQTPDGHSQIASQVPEISSDEPLIALYDQSAPFIADHLSLSASKDATKQIGSSLSPIIISDDSSIQHDWKGNGSSSNKSPIPVSDESTISSVKELKPAENLSMKSIEDNLAQDISSLTIQGDSSTPIKNGSPNDFEDNLILFNEIPSSELNESTPIQVMHTSPQQLAQSGLSSGNYIEDELTPLQALVTTSPPTEDTPPSVLSSSSNFTEKTRRMSTHEGDIRKESNHPSASVIDASPILESAYKLSVASNSPVLNEDGRNAYNNRPISMSFRGLKGPSFGNKLSQHNLRSSDSHQSFNISFGDEDSDLAGSEVGAGFGSSDDEDNICSDEEILATNGSLNDKENQYNNPLSKKERRGSLNRNISNVSSVITPPSVPFKHNRIPSISSNSSVSSPRSFSSMISRRVKRSPQVHSMLNMTKVSKRQPKGVKFSSRIILYDTYDDEEYDRHPDAATCNQLTPLLAQQIKEELNSVKSEMEVHQDSRCFTHFF
ncbi:uncharacterized protein PRCAT00005540001 [Priceomyces carsonii]|uniref:uncharacterized protein n=1 Tax=Priceomyces carsonii TaxID=28549 RepID=UPI002EDB9BAB|nr:unnamed protein product [Priceomyces carsonii]